MRDESTLLDHLEEWLTAQVPKDLHDLPLRMIETMERVSNELMETLNIQGSSSISLPFPPFSGKEVPPPPPPSTFQSLLPTALYDKGHRLAKAHPYVMGTGAAVALTLGVGLGTAYLGYGGKYGRAIRARRQFGLRAVSENGLLKEAIVILSPSPLPPMLMVLTVTLLKAGYIVLIAVPRVEEAESIEKRLSTLEERSALRVLIYDPEDSTTFPPFHRSLLATLTLRFTTLDGTAIHSDPYNPQPSHIPHIHAFISLYPLNPTPPHQPGALPALPTLLAPDRRSGKAPMLITLYSSGSVLVQPDDFASQMVTANHRLLAENLKIRSGSRIVSLYLGNIQLPTLNQLILRPIAAQGFSEKWTQATSLGKLTVAKDLFLDKLTNAYTSFVGRIGLGSAAKYEVFEKNLLMVLKSRRGRLVSIGQYSFLPFVLARLFPPTLLRSLLPILPAMPGATGPGSYISNLSTDAPGVGGGSSSASEMSSSGMFDKPTGKPNTQRSQSGSNTNSRLSSSLGDVSANKTQSSTSASDSEHESGEDLGSSIHSIHSAHTASSRESGYRGLDDSWAHVDDAA